MGSYMPMGSKKATRGSTGRFGDKFGLLPNLVPEMLGVNSSYSSLSVRTLLGSRSICLIMVEVVRVVLAPGSAQRRHYHYPSHRGNLVVNQE